MIAEIAVAPGTIIAWIVIGLLAGLFSALVKKSKPYVLIGYMIVGMIGAVISGLVFGLIVSGEGRFWGSIVVALLGAHLVIAMFRFAGYGRTES